MVLHLCSADCVCTTLGDPLVGMYTYTLHTNIHQYTPIYIHTCTHTYAIRSARNRYLDPVCTRTQQYLDLGLCCPLLEGSLQETHKWKETPTCIQGA